MAGSAEKIVIRGAREHNLKNIDVTLPRDKLVVITGLSGSGKSSLAFDTLYAEGQRRYVESLSSYARQFLGQMEKPEVESIEGLSPAISIDQKTTSKNPRSTVGTITEIYDYLRVLFANVGTPHCPNDGSVIAAQTADQIVEQLAALADGTKVQLLAPVVKDRKGEYKRMLVDLAQQGFSRVRVDGKFGELSDDWKMGRYDKHTIEVVVDRVVVRKDSQVSKPSKTSKDSSDSGDSNGSAPSDDQRQRLTDAVEQALKLGEGQIVAVLDKEERNFSEKFACNKCGFSMAELAPRSFSFNGPHGACPSCTGLGFSLEVDPAVVITDPNLSLNEGALNGTVTLSSPWILKELAQVARYYKFDMRTPWKDLPKKAQNIVMHGTDDDVPMRFASKSGSFVWEGTDQYEGVVPRLTRYYRETESESKRERIQGLMATKPCKVCKGTRLKPEILAVTVAGKSIADLTSMPVGRMLPYVAELEGALDERQRKISHEVLKEIRERLRFMVNVGLDYLSLDRASATLSGGEAQRIRLATQIGSGLVGVLYILDEPSIGLHQRDNQRLIRSLKGLRDLGNTLLVVEHDEEMIRSADWVLDLGPGAGEHGGHVVAEGAPAAIEKNPKSITGAYLSGRESVAVPDGRRAGSGKKIVVRAARENNLKRVDVAFPLGKLIAVTGVSGSGKSSLVNDVLWKALARDLMGAKESPGAHDRIDGKEHVDKVIIIDQQPIGRTPRSNPATYTGLFTPIRELFAATQDAKVRGFDKGRFSFNVRGGRCEACEGDGVVQIEMHFLADVYVH
ncbi:MAG: excinuclease ABC subunit UvrA, partial [Thermoplasmatota archaeon]